LDLVAKIGGFTGPLDKAAKKSKKTSDDIAKYGKVLGIGIATGAAAAVTGLALLVNKQREVIDEQSKMAKLFNTSYESLSNLGRAGQLAGVSMEQIATATRQLDINMGKAIAGEKAQADAFKRLGINAKEFADLPLDERVASFNKALAANVPAAERSAVAADIFGARTAAAIRALDAGTIEEAARQVKIFGLNLSDTDATKVEMANDALSTMGMLVEGVSNQLTVQLAPVLKFIGDEFLRTAENAGGLGAVVKDSIDKVLPVIEFTVNVVSAIVRQFELAGKVAAAAGIGMSLALWEVANVVFNGPIFAVNKLIELLNTLPGIDIEPVGLTNFGKAIRDEVDLLTKALPEALKDIAETAVKPLAGEGLTEAYKRIQAAAEAAAASAVKTGKAFKDTGVAGDDEESKKRKEAIDKQISALERAAYTWGMSADAIVAHDLRTQGATESQIKYAEALSQAVIGLDEGKKKLEEMAAAQEKLAALGDAPGAALAEDEISKIWLGYDAQLKALEQFNAEKLLLMQQAGANEVALEAANTAMVMDYAEKKKAFQINAAASTSGALSNILQNLMVATDSKNKTMFTAMKAFAIGEAIISTYTGAANALKTVPYPFNFVAAAAVVASGMAQVAKIRATQPGGAASSAIGMGGAAAPDYGGGSFNAYPSPERDVKAPQNITFIVNSHSLDPSQVNWNKLFENNIKPAMESLSGDGLVPLNIRVVNA